MVSLRKHIVAALSICAAVILIGPNLGLTETAHRKNISSPFQVHADIRPRVEFWKLIFTKYGKDDLVFHHRDYPEVIYSVLDVSHYRSSMSERAFNKKEESIIKAERKRIFAALDNLHAGRKASNELEQRIERLFKTVPGSRSKYKAAATRKQVRVQSGIKERFRDGIIRSGRYMSSIEAIFRDANLPTELARIPLIESSFDYDAYSSVGAAGVWQFIRSTGRSYMRINASIDERRDPILATRAATRYLSYAYEQLDSWPLAITSYNHGINGMRRAYKKVGTRDIGAIIEKYDGRRFGFASKNFYVEFVAALEIEQNPQKYFPGIVIEDPLLFDEIDLGRSMYFRDLVKFSGESATTIKAFNKGFRPPITSNRVKIPASSLVKVPRGKGRLVVAKTSRSKLLNVDDGTEVFIARIDDIKKENRAGQRYRVRPGDTIGAIARRFRVSQRDLMARNNIRNANRIRIGQTIRIPGYGRSVSNGKASKGKAWYSVSKSGPYKIRRGDTIGGIARKFGVSQSALMRVNGIKDARSIRAGQTLKIPAGSSGSSSKVHIVRSGENLSVIAKKHGVSVRVLKKLNSGLTAAIFPGQKIRVK